ncbi:FBXW7 [Branchiostoma lanceolatum]|uniref:FBXW7 protein n=1 Tax=Branchiostoma lanceolatum TaxID=7740 RepID=A0A8J9ZQN6_BRALA|nr:FBXW7 [Branchiostoma lanceolatum]
MHGTDLHVATDAGVTGRSHQPRRMKEANEFKSWLSQLSRDFSDLDDKQRNETLDLLIATSGASQLSHLSTKLETLLKRDFLRLLPLELSFYLCTFLDPKTLLRCCVVSKQWNKVVSGCSQAWYAACWQIGLRMDCDEKSQDGPLLKHSYLRAISRHRDLEDGTAFESTSLYGHSARVYALYYSEGKLATGSDDLSVRLWDVQTGKCLHVIETHTCADLKFDKDKVVTASFDNTLACWDWATGQRAQVFVGHVGAVFSVDYSDELQLLASGSADGTVNLWALNTGECYNVFRGHTEWVTRVILRKCQVDSVVHRAGEYVLISMDRNEIKIWPISTEVNCKPLRTLAVSEDKSISLLPRLQFDGRGIVCASDIGIYLWDFATFELRIIPTKQCSPALLGFGTVFSLIYHWQHLYVMDVRTQRYICKYPLPVIRKSKRGSSIIAGDCDWLDGFELNEKLGLVFATSMPDHSIFLIRWRKNDT